MLPVLENTRHERFAQGLAKGMTQVQAYAEAGYRGGYPGKLMRNAAIQARAAEIVEGAAARAEITVPMVTENLLRIAAKAEDIGGAPGLGVARAAWMDTAKLNRLLVDRSEVAQETVTVVLSGQPMTEEEWMAQYGAGAADEI